MSNRRIVRVIGGLQMIDGGEAELTKKG